MCDTMVALGDATADGSVILAKNSDREPNEAHVLAWYPRGSHKRDARVQCTYISVPQVSETYEILLCKPFWLWGCEMGANEKGVAIGNEAVFTKEPHADTGLLGMDLMRLALERAASAETALQVITDLIQEYGQGGACGYRNKRLHYHNSFIIADPTKAWVLETAGKHWVAERVRDVRTISNRLTIGSDYDLSSPEVVAHARARGWLKQGETFDFARCYSDRFYTTFSRSAARHSRSTELLLHQAGRITPQTLMSTLRDHGEGMDAAAFEPARSSMASICMHAGNGLTRDSQSTGSLVAHLRRDLRTYWVTGTSAPCTSVFKPVYLDGRTLPSHGPEPTGASDEATLWWRHERLHRATLEDYPSRHALYSGERDRLEAQFLTESEALTEESSALTEAQRVAARAAFSQRCFDEALEATAEWLARVASAPPRKWLPWIYSAYWRGQARLAGYLQEALREDSSSRRSLG